MRLHAVSLAALILVAGGPAVARDEQDDTAYSNEELGLWFGGVYGWQKRAAEGSGAWSELASYRFDDYDASVRLLVRDNPFGTTAELRKAIEAEFKASEQPAAGRPAFKDVKIVVAAMRKGLKLPGIEVEAVAVRIDAGGKKREHTLLVRTYFGRKRLFRVACSVRRSRAKRVRDLFQRAVTSLKVTAQDQQVALGFPFASERGQYRCIVPEGYGGRLPAGGNADMRFVSADGGVTISIFAYAYDGMLIDHVEEMIDYYGNDIEMTNEEADVLGGKGFLARVKRGDQVTLVVGTVQAGRVYRIHTTASRKQLAEAERAHAAIRKDFKILR